MSNPLKDLGLSSEELKAIAKIRGIKDYKSMSKGELLIALSPSKPAKKGKKTKTSFSKAKREKIRKEFNESRYKFSKLKIKEIRKHVYKIEMKRTSLNQKKRD